MLGVGYPFFVQASQFPQLDEQHGRFHLGHSVVKAETNMVITTAHPMIADTTALFGDFLIIGGDHELKEVKKYGR